MILNPPICLLFLFETAYNLHNICTLFICSSTFLVSFSHYFMFYIFFSILEPDILECEVKWALGSITMNKASGSDIITAISNPERWGCESSALNMPANLENSAVATGLEKVSFHSNPKERQCHRMLKLLHNCTHLTR